LSFGDEPLRLRFGAGEDWITRPLLPLRRLRGGLFEGRRVSVALRLVVLLFFIGAAEPEECRMVDPADPDEPGGVCAPPSLPSEGVEGSDGAEGT
jgi:hypothetical protein